MIEKNKKLRNFSLHKTSNILFLKLFSTVLTHFNTEMRHGAYTIRHTHFNGFKSILCENENELTT